MQNIIHHHSLLITIGTSNGPIREALLCPSPENVLPNSCHALYHSSRHLSYSPHPRQCLRSHYSSRTQFGQLYYNQPLEKTPPARVSRTRYANHLRRRMSCTSSSRL